MVDRFLFALLTSRSATLSLSLSVNIVLYSFAERKTPQAPTARQYDHFFRSAAPLFEAERLAVDFPQSFSYDRTEELELWLLRRRGG